MTSSAIGQLGTSPSPSATPDRPPDLVVARVTGAVEVAYEFGAPLELETLVDLMPEYGPRTVDDLVAWIRHHPESSRVSGRFAGSNRGPVVTPTPDRRQRAEQYWRATGALFDADLKATEPWLRFLGLTGSVAYGDPDDGDDCDLMAIVRPGTVWLFLAYAFIRLRKRRRAGSGPRDPQWCLNYVLDEEAAGREYSHPRGFLFAREALVVRPVRGSDYYRTLLSRGDWLREEAPRLYARWDATETTGPAEAPPAPPALRALNALLFPVVAAFLQLKGLWRNHQLWSSGRGEETFRTVTRLDRMTLATRKFERLSARMSSGNRLAPQ